MPAQRIICPKCERSIKSLNAYHYCKKVEIDDLFLNKSDDILLAFDQLYTRLSELEEVAISATKNCIVFVRNKTFVVAKPMTKFLEIKFYANEPIEDDDLHKCRLWGSKYEGIIRVRNEYELKPKYFQYFEESHEIS